MKTPLTMETVAMADLSEPDLAGWRKLRSADPRFESPYHHPDYHRLVDRHQGGCNVTLARQDGKVVALLPWQGGAFARASGAPLSDYQDVICEAGLELGPSDLLSGQSVGAFHYTAMTSDQGEATCRMEIDQPEAWREARDGSYRRHMKSTRRRIRKAEDDLGPRHIVLQSRDIDAYSTLMRWKRDKFSETGKFDVLANPGTCGLLQQLWERGPKADLRADLHALYFGDRLAACDLGLTDGEVFHSWIVGYDPALMSYAPGIQLLEAVIDATPELGYRVIDLGPGLDGYKRHYATHSRHVEAGVVSLPSPAGWWAAGYDGLEKTLKSRTGDALGKLRRRYSQVAACEPTFARRSLAMAEAISQGIGLKST